MIQTMTLPMTLLLPKSFIKLKLDETVSEKLKKFALESEANNFISKAARVGCLK